MKFCSACGHAVTLKIPPGDSLPRHCCEGCGTIHYQNPRMIVGCIPEWEDRILLCRRAIEPRHGLWTVPAGFMENNETLQQAAARGLIERMAADGLHGDAMDGKGAGGDRHPRFAQAAVVAVQAREAAGVGVDADHRDGQLDDLVVPGGAGGFRVQESDVHGGEGWMLGLLPHAAGR